MVFEIDMFKGSRLTVSHTNENWVKFLVCKVQCTTAPLHSRHALEGMEPTF